MKKALRDTNTARWLY